MVIVESQNGKVFANMETGLIFEFVDTIRTPEGEEIPSKDKFGIAMANSRVDIFLGEFTDREKAWREFEELKRACSLGRDYKIQYR